MILYHLSCSGEQRSYTTRPADNKRFVKMCCTKMFRLKIKCSTFNQNTSKNTRLALLSLILETGLSNEPAALGCPQ